MTISPEAASTRAAHPASLVPLLTRKSIRVLHLHPGIGTASISGTLSVVDLADAVRGAYDAISYTWGPEPTPACPALSVTINGQEVFIRQSLHECLLRLRLQETPRILWNDFLCIDQERLDEKARQVTMIGEVFRAAEAVQVWVGEHEGGSEMLFRGWPKFGKKNDGRAVGLVKELDRMVLRRSKLSRAESKRRASVWMRFFNRRYLGKGLDSPRASASKGHCGPLW